MGRWSTLFDELGIDGGGALAIKPNSDVTRAVSGHRPHNLLSQETYHALQPAAHLGAFRGNVHESDDKLVLRQVMYAA
jgi:hypothetical protein